jgi:hypothetical protein
MEYEELVERDAEIAVSLWAYTANETERTVLLDIISRVKPRAPESGAMIPPPPLSFSCIVQKSRPVSSLGE